MEQLDELVVALLKAHRTGGTVSAALFADLSREDAAAIQLRVAEALGGPLAAAKIGMADDGTAMVAAIPNGMILKSGETLAQPVRPQGKLEVEVAVRLTKDLVSGSGVNVRDCVGELLMTIEIIGSRLDDRKAAGPWGPFADAMVTAGLVVGSQPLGARASTPDGLPISVVVDGREQLSASAKHPFGGVFVPLQAFSDRNAPGLLSLPAGCVVTTGSLALVSMPDAGEVVARLGGYEPVILQVGR
jgi:2-keto-4-pentenoate hydratase